MMNFKQYMKESSDDEDVSKTLSKIPKSHSDLVRGYKIVFQPGNCLKGDDKHIGLIDEKNKTITIASPWNYGREYTLLHEVAHAVWKFLLSKKNKNEWKRLLEQEREKGKPHIRQNHEEIFCMTYAQYYAKNKLKKFDHPVLVNFISSLNHE